MTWAYVKLTKMANTAVLRLQIHADASNFLDRPRNWTWVLRLVQLACLPTNLLSPTCVLMIILVKLVYVFIVTRINPKLRIDHSLKLFPSHLTNKYLNFLGLHVYILHFKLKLCTLLTHLNFEGESSLVLKLCETVSFLNIANLKNSPTPSSCLRVHASLSSTWP